MFYVCVVGVHAVRFLKGFFCHICVVGVVVLAASHYCYFSCTCYVLLACLLLLKLVLLFLCCPFVYFVCCF